MLLLKISVSYRNGMDEFYRLTYEDADEKDEEVEEIIRDILSNSEYQHYWESFGWERITDKNIIKEYLEKKIQKDLRSIKSFRNDIKFLKDEILKLGV